MSRFVGPWIRGRFPCFLGVISVTMLAIGCGAQSRLPVAGEVRFDGQPVEVGQIAFYPASQTTGVPMATGILNGEFQLAGPDGLRAGKYRVQVTAMRERESGETALAGPLVNLPEQYIPVKYNDETVLEVEVRPEEHNYFEFDLAAN